MALDLTGAEFSLLWLLISQAGRIVSKADLSLQGLGKTLTQYDRSIDVHISNIRQKLGPRADGQPWIEAVRGKVISGCVINMARVRWGSCSGNFS